jgi:hypothetical protein
MEVLGHVAHQCAKWLEVQCAAIGVLIGSSPGLPKAPLTY